MVELWCQVIGEQIGVTSGTNLIHKSIITFSEGLSTAYKQVKTLDYCLNQGSCVVMQEITGPLHTTTI